MIHMKIMSGKKLYFFIIIITFSIFTLASAALAGMASENYHLSASVVSSGCKTMNSLNYRLNSTLGQSSPLMDSVYPPFSDNYTLYPGFWYTLSYESSQWVIEVGEGCFYTSIQQAIDNAGYDDIILVHDGTYNENINFKNKGIIMYSENGPNQTIIDGNVVGPVVSFENEDRGSVFMGFTIKNGYAQNGGGIYCQNSSPIIADCIITGNETSLNGSGIYGYNAFPQIINCLLFGNMNNAVPNQICLNDGSGTTYHDAQIITYSDNDKVCVGIFHQVTGRWRAGYRFFGKPCGLNEQVQANEFFFISFLP